ncbi:MAG: polyphosphate kinase 1 [Acidimicrobiia bacterium]
MPDSVATGEPDRFLNRELSWLAFNERVLALADDPARPILERAKFCAIFSSNLDEFFQVRVSAIQEQVAAGVRTTPADGMRPIDQLRAVRRVVERLSSQLAATFRHAIVPELEKHNIEFVDWSDLRADDHEYLDEVFERLVYPVLTPLAVDPAHPFPYISNLSLNLAVTVRDPESGVERFARVKVPQLLPRFVALPDHERFVALEQLIAAHLPRLFPGMEVVEHFPFRVTRDADFELADESEDLLAAMEVVLRQRSKFGHVVRLEIDTTMTEDILELLCRELELSRADVYVVDAPLDLGGLMELYALNRSDLKAPAWVPQTPAVIAGTTEAPPDFFRALREGDLLVHHPYDSFTTSVEAFLDQAARDPHVLAIKQTLYRTAGDDRGIVRSLVSAAEAGKQVVALVELKARFDEQANIERARVLEEAGVHVVFGLVGLKTHAKLLLVVRQEDDGIRRYFHIGTGNYNPKTAHVYEDLGLFSTNLELGQDLSDLFNHLTGYSHDGNYQHLVVAPSQMRNQLRALIEAETANGATGRITFKMNSLVDPEMIDLLYRASQAGCTVDLIVRGICCLRPGVAGLSENIRVRSLIGRFLEHSRVYRFGQPGDSAEYLLGSADLMPRNLDRRVEALVPIDTPALRSELDTMLATCLADDTLAWTLDGDGTWHKLATVVGTNTHDALMQQALLRTLPRG